MKIYETLDRDPRTSPLANGGQARILPGSDERAVREIRAELETFVCDGQYGDALQRILQSYLTQLDRPRQNAAWISGFFGSGKSHLLKVFAHLWVDTAFEDGATARSLVRGLSDDVVAMFRELDTQAARIGKPRVAAAGSLPQGSKEHVRHTVLAVLLRACGFPEHYPQAQFCFWLREQGYLDRVRNAVEAAGKPWLKELNNLYVSGPIAVALLACDRNFARDEREARQVLRERFPSRTSDITTAEFLAACREALATEGELPLTALVLDEVQQYIGDSTDRAVHITELAEAIQTQLDSRVLLVASGQSALTGTPQLQRLKDRFRITVQLSDTDVEAVTRKVLLHKKASAVEPIGETLARHAGEVSKHLQGSRLAERPSDRTIAVADYPLLPTRRRFWEECFRAVDAAGTQSQLRSQLHILHEGLRLIAPQDLGVVIPGDALYDAISSNLVNTGVLLGEIATRIREQDDGSVVGRLRRRIGGIVFLIGKLSREAGRDLGVRATARVVADLLVDDLRVDSGPFRKEVETQLEAMAEAGTLMKVGDEYRLQTTQGAEWDRAFRERAGAIRQQLPELQARQDQLLAAAVQEVVGSLRRQHGESKVPRTFVLHPRSDAPGEAGEQIVVWLRDGSSSTQREVEAEARRRGQEDPILHVFVPKPGDELRARICEAEASRMVLEAKGEPTEPPEAREACESMRSRRAKATGERDELVRDLLAAAKVYQGGGTEVFGENLPEKLERAMDASLARRFPRFAEGDHRGWGAALTRARDGSDEPLKVLGWDRPTEEHPVVREALTQIGAGAKGGDIRKALKGAPYGWPQDAVDAALIALHRAGTVRVTLNERPVPPGQLDQNKISMAEFRPERVRLGVPEKLAIRGLYQQADVAVKSGEEEAKAADFLARLRALADEAGGDAPLPVRPSMEPIDKLQRLVGTEQLGGLLAAKADLEACIREWRARGRRAAERLPRWQHLERLARQAVPLPVMAEVGPEIEAIRKGRTLLDDTDFVTPLCKRLESSLRDALRDAHARCERVHAECRAALEATPDWQRLPPAKRAEIEHSNRLDPVPALDVGDAARLVASLEQRPLDRWAELVEGLPTRFAKAREDAARALEPAVTSVRLQSPILRTEADVAAWIRDTQADLLRRIGDGPVVIG